MAGHSHMAMQKAQPPSMQMAENKQITDSPIQLADERFFQKAPFFSTIFRLPFAKDICYNPDVFIKGTLSYE